MFLPECLNGLKTTDSAFVDSATIYQLLQNLRDVAKRNSVTRLDFDSANVLEDADYRNLTGLPRENFDVLEDADYRNLTGLPRENFDELCEYITSQVRNTPARSTRTSLGIFLMKLRSGVSNKLLSTLFNVTKSSVRRAVACVRQCLMTSFVPQNLGLQHITRESVITEHTRPLAKKLFGNECPNQVILVPDGTYIYMYIQKSNNFAFQRRSFSFHKGRPLVKPMVVATTSGYFLTVIGPYLGDQKNNDASILDHMMKTNVEDIKTWVHEADVFIVNRGFRDSLMLLEELGIQAEMPAFMTKGEKQMSTEDANASTLVTKVRCVVESANARIKRWKLLDRVLPTNQVPFIGDYVRIVCATSNKFFPDLNVTTDTAQDMCIGATMLDMADKVNSLKSYIDEHELDKRSANWKPANETDLEDFPGLDEEQLRTLTCGTYMYQLKLCTSYVQEHVDGDSIIHIHKEEEHLIRIRIQSRRTSSKTYLLWIRYNATGIESWYCKCRAGGRVVGVCSHIASMLWFLGYARHTSRKRYGVQNWGTYLNDASQIPKSLVNQKVMKVVSRNERQDNSFGNNEYTIERLALIESVPVK